MRFEPNFEAILETSASILRLLVLDQQPRFLQRCLFRLIATLGPSQGVLAFDFHATSRFPEAGLPAMSTRRTLHRLYTLDPSSPGFLHHLHALIRQDKAEQYLTSLQGSELARLVDFLDQVRTLPSSSAFPTVTKRALQTFSDISADDDAPRQCLRKLQAVCGRHATLPSSCTISADDLTRVGDHPTALGGITDVWEGTHRGKRVFIKALKAPLDDDQTIRKVCTRCGTSLSPLLKNTCIVILQRGRYLEKVEAPEHRPFRWRHNKPFANHLGMDP